MHLRIMRPKRCLFLLPPFRSQGWAGKSYVAVSGAARQHDQLCLVITQLIKDVFTTHLSCMMRRVFRPAFHFIRPPDSASQGKQPCINLVNGWL